MAPLTVGEIMVVQAGEGKKKTALKEGKMGKQVEIIVREESDGSRLGGFCDQE